MMQLPPKSPDVFLDELLYALKRDEHERWLYGAYVVDGFYDYCRIWEFVLARRPGLWGQLEKALHLVKWTMEIGEGGEAAREWYDAQEESC